MAVESRSRCAPDSPDIVNERLRDMFHTNSQNIRSNVDRIGAWACYAQLTAVGGVSVVNYGSEVCSKSSQFSQLRVSLLLYGSRFAALGQLISLMQKYHSR